MATTSLVAATAGIVLTLDPQAGQPGNITTLSGANVSLSILYPDGVTTTRITSGVAVNSGSLTASYTTTAQDFPVPGTYMVQLCCDFGTSNPASAPLPFTFAKRL